MNNILADIILDNNNKGGGLTSKEIGILTKCKQFYESDRKYVKLLLSIIDGRSTISIRVIEWFVVNYSRVYRTAYNIKVNGVITKFHVSEQYRVQLKGCSKQYFDPFCRERKVIYTYRNVKNSKKPVIFSSSICQLNFFYWAIKNKVLKYIESHVSEIETDMKNISKAVKKMQPVPDKRKVKKRVISDVPDPEICSSEKINSITWLEEESEDTDSETKVKPRKRRVRMYPNISGGIEISSGNFSVDFD